jgi:predicted GTPase
MADAIVINKIDTADLCSIEDVRENIAALNPRAIVIDGASPIRVDRPERITGKRVLCVEDGPTLTHGGMRYGAAVMAARKFHAGEIVDPRPWITGSIAKTFVKYPDIGPLLPAMGYGHEQVKDLQKTIARVDCDLVLIGTPIDLQRYVKIPQPSLRVMYDLQEIGHPDLKDVIGKYIKL